MNPRSKRTDPGSPEEWMCHAESDLKLALLAAGHADTLVKAAPLLELLGADWGKYLSRPVPKAVRESLQRCERTGRPLGDAAFVSRIETMLGRALTPRKAGRKPLKKGK
ncbi:MAG: hypothetical protein AB1742_12340 [bacterium]